MLNFQVTKYITKIFIRMMDSESFELYFVSHFETSSIRIWSLAADHDEARRRRRTGPIDHINMGFVYSKSASNSYAQYFGKHAACSYACMRLVEYISGGRPFICVYEGTFKASHLFCCFHCRSFGTSNALNQYTRVPTATVNPNIVRVCQRCSFGPFFCDVFLRFRSFLCIF